MTAKEIETTVRAIQRVCRGPRRKTLDPQDYTRMSPELRDALAIVDARDKAAEQSDSTSAVDQVSYLVGELLQLNARVEAGALDELLRQPCGADFNNIILAGELDGELHQYACPQCGVSGVYRAPNFSNQE